jgi:hypothetical protein
MQIFLTYASEQKATAEAIAFSLRSRGHKVFLDKDDLPPGQSYDEQIETAIANSDYLLFLISPESVKPGRYTLTELEHARRKWRSPDGYILPVMVAPTDMAMVPKFLSAVTILEPKGNVAAEVAAHVKETDRHATKNLLAYFAAAGAASGLLTFFLPILPGTGLLKPIVLTNISPGIYFGFALCALFHWKLRSPARALMLALLMVQLAWQGAVATALVVGPEVKLADREIAVTTPDSSEPSQDAEAPADSPPTTETETAVEESRPLLRRNDIIPGILAGAVGAFGTWLAGLFCHRGLRSFDAAIVTTFVGAVLGTLLAANEFVLYVAWQSAVAASIARGVVKHR